MLLASLLCLAIWLYLLTAHGRFWRPYFLPAAAAPLSWPRVVAIVPARNEADVLPQSLSSLLAQDYPGEWHVYLIDDRSEDGTGDVARQLATAHPGRLTVLPHNGPPPGWSGKLAAMQAGVEASAAAGGSDYILFCDADIAHPPQQLRRLVASAAAWKSPLVSLMVMLHCRNAWEKLFIPAFIYFFQLLYPFRRIADDRSPVAGAAGGVMLAHRATLEQAGGLAAIKGKLIDDCALGKLLKDKVRHERRSVVLANCRETHSLRPYPAAADIWRMIARTAYEQLNFSPLLLAGCAIGLSLVFIWPLLMLASGEADASLLALFTLGIMAFTYWPTLALYGLEAWRAPTLPFVTLFYMGATLDSARLHYLGKGGAWKGRVYADHAEAGKKDNAS